MRPSSLTLDSLYREIAALQRQVRELQGGTVTATITVAEEDGAPSVSASTIEVPNGTLTNDGGGVVSLDYAISSKGVTNGDSHDHSGGDGAQVDHTGLSNIGTNTHAQIDSHITSHASRHKWLGADPLSVGDLMMNSYPAMFKDWRNLDGFVQSNSGTGALTVGLMYLTATTGATNGSRACCYGAGVTAMIQTTSLLANFRTRLNPSTALTNSTIWMGIFTNPTAPTSTEHHAGFKIVNGTVYATCGNGSAQTVEATGDTLGASAMMEFYLKEKTNQIEYYVNGVLRKTFTTNRPNSGTMYVTFCLTNQAAETKTTLVGPYWIMSGAI